MGNNFLIFSLIFGVVAFLFEFLLMRFSYIKDKNSKKWKRLNFPIYALIFVILINTIPIVNVIFLILYIFRTSYFLFNSEFVIGNPDKKFYKKTMDIIKWANKDINEVKEA
jgi:hypothetical protein